MKAFYKILGLTLASALVLASCTKETPYSPGEPAGTQDVFFSDLNESVVVLGLEDLEFSILLERADASASLTVPVSAWCREEKIISVPETVTFDAGSKYALINVTVSNMDPFVEYQMKVSIPSEYTQPYKIDAGLPECGFIFYKEDYSVVATGVFDDIFLYEEAWDDVLLYSEYLKLYKFDPFGGDPFKFSIDSKGNLTFDKKEYYTGVDYNASYGGIYAQPVEAYYDSAKDEIHIVTKFTLPKAGAAFVGEYDEVFYIDEWL